MKLITERAQARSRGSETSLTNWGTDMPEMNDEEKLKQRLKLTTPDYVTYVPSGLSDLAEDKGNEHFLVFDGPDATLMAVWAQAWLSPGKGNVNRTVFAYSRDEGETWSSPTLVAGPKDRDDPTHMASWAFPMVSRSGRIYVVYNQNKGVKGWILFHTGGMAGVYSDDRGKTWSEPQSIAMPTSPYDDPEGNIPPEWIVWQKPMRDLSGGYFVGYSHWLHPAVATLKQIRDWTEIESVIEFMRFENVDDDPDPRDLRVRYTAWGDEALRVPHRDHPNLSIAQEPSLVRLPDDRLFCIMRTCTGYIWWSQSLDDGENWCSPRPLLNKDFGLPLMNPVSPDPIYSLSDGRYVLFHNNNRGGKVAGGSIDATPREPLYVSLGEFRPGADQPVWFSAPKLFMATGGVGVDGVKRNINEPGSGSLSMYSSFTNRNGTDVLWYPDSKFFLLGKRVTKEFLSGMEIPAK